MKLNLSAYLTIKTQKYEETTMPSLGGGVIISNEWVDSEQGYYKVQKNVYRTVVTLNDNLKTLLSNMIEDARSVRLVLTDVQNSSMLADIIQGSTTRVIIDNTLSIDLTDFCQGNSSEKIIYIEGSSVGLVNFSRSGEFAPYIEVLAQGIAYPSPIESVSVVQGVSGDINLETGKINFTIEGVKAESSVKGVGLGLVHSSAGFKLNLEETFKDGVLTKANDNTLAVSEKFYYNSDGVKRTIKKSLVTVKADGTYCATVGNKTVDVIREEVFSDNTKAVTIPEGLKNAKFYENRSDELKQVQDQIDNYKRTADDFVVWKWKDATCLDILDEKLYADLSNADSLASIESAIERGYKISTKGEYFNITQILKQKKALVDKYTEEGGKDYVLNYKEDVSQSNDVFYNELQLRQAIAVYNKTLIYYYTNYLEETCPVSDGYMELVDLTDMLTDEDTVYEHVESSNSFPHSDIFLPTYISNRDVKDLLYARNAYVVQLKKIEADRAFQENTYSEQIDYYVGLGENYLSELQAIFKEYYQLKDLEQKIIKNTPISFISYGDTFKGYNDDGELIIIFKDEESYANIVRDNQGKITEIVDEKGNSVQITYDYDGNVKYLYDVSGVRTEFDFPTANKVTVTYLGGRKTVVELQSGKVVKVSSDGVVATVSYNGDTFSGIVRTSEATSTQIDTYSFDKLYSNITITDYDKTTVKSAYLNNRLTSRYVIVDGVVASAFKVTPYASSESIYKTSSKVEHASKSTLYGQESAVEFGGDVEISEYDDFNRLTKSVYDGLSQTKTTTYTYDEDKLLKQETTVLNKKDNTQYSAITEYCYNAKGAKTKTVSYVLGEELINGKSVEEYEYDEKGNLVKSFTYNTLDSSSRFYTEYEYNISGERIAELDQTGQYKTKYAYMPKSARISSLTMPNGSKFAFGYDETGNTTSISQSTEDGEENATQRIYQNGLLTKVISKNTVVEYEYDSKRRISQIKVNGITQKSFSYSADDKTVTESRNDGTIYVTVSDGFGNVLTVNRNGTVIESNTYKKGLLKTSVVGGVTYTYSYDSEDRLQQITYSDGTSSTTYTYDNNGSLTEKTCGDDVAQYSYSEDSAKRLIQACKGGLTTNFAVDVNGRALSKEVINSSNTVIIRDEITYLKKGDHSTSIPVSIKYFDRGVGACKDTLRYTYDSSGNITQITENGKLLVKYTYDGINRLIREDNVALAKSYFFEYDGAGNITSKRTCGFTLEKSESITSFTSQNVFSYDGDLLKAKDSTWCSYSNGIVSNFLTKPITFKEGGLISSYKGTSFAYDNYGKRTAKGSITYTYDKNGLLVSQSNGISFIYDHDDQMIGIKNGTSPYYFRKNLQGDIIALLDSFGFVVVKYVYDAWGNHKIYDSNGAEITSTTHIGMLNPIRYRGYYYDSETQLYYCNSRYYSPEVCRFISADSVDYVDPDSINGLNLYAYCANNPIMYTDPSGHMPEWLQDALNVLGAVVIAVGVTALTVATAGLATCALGASAVMIGAVTTGATIGGLVAGGLEIGAQIYANGIGGMNLGAIAIESFAGSAYGAISGVASTTTYAALGLGMRGAKVALGGLGTALHGISKGDSFDTIMLNVGVSIGTGILIQGVFAGLNAYTGKLSSDVLQNYALDGALNFEGNQLLSMLGILACKNIWRNRGLFI